MESKISIIIPAYNVEDYIEECINSLLNQSYKNVEIICVDDNSQDGTADIIKKFQKADGRIKFVSNNRNKGAGYARNRGFEVAIGEYIYFIDADDYILEGTLETLVTLAYKYSTECIFFDCVVKQETNMLRYTNGEYGLYDIEKKVLTGSELFKIMMDNDVFSGAVWRQFWKRDFLLQKHIKFEEKLTSCEDTPFSVHAILQGTRMMVVNKQLYVYRKHEGTVVSNVTPEKAKCAFYAYCMILKELLNEDYSNNVKKALEKRCQQSLLTAKRLYERNRFNIRAKDFPELFESHLFELIIEQKDYCVQKIDKALIKKIKDYEYVLIYGDGAYAMDVLHTMRNANIEIHGFAVTNKKNKNLDIVGIPIKEIQEYKNCVKETIVIIGVADDRIESVERILNKYGFSNYIDLRGKM